MLQDRVLFKLVMRVVVLMLTAFMTSNIIAAGTVTMGAITKNIHGAMKDFLTIFQDIGLVAGIGFVIGSFFKFHQHKMNPTQVPLSQGITLLLVGAGLSAFPHLIGTVLDTAFGVTAPGGTVTQIIS